MPEIVIADDDAAILQVLSAFCECEGWSVRTCADGREILAALAQGRAPVLVLIDINMPVMNGIEAIEEIISVARPMRIRFMTGGEDAPMLAAKMIARARDLTVGNSIYKPISREKFVAILGDEARLLARMGEGAGGGAGESAPEDGA